MDRLKTLAAHSRFRVGALLVQPDRLILALDGNEIALEPRMMEVLVALAEHAGEVVSAEQLLIEVWRGTFYGDNPVHKAIAQLRKLIGDDSRAPRYIETIRKRGYRLIANVSYPDDYRRSSVQTTAWADRSPYVGLTAFDGDYADVFFGRSRMTAELLAAMRSQLRSQRRFVLMVGASGCGKTSLLRAGAIPLLRQDSGFDGLHALSVATCDLAGADDGDLLTSLASALADWSLEDRPVFAPQPAADLASAIRQAPDLLATTIEDAFRRHPSRTVASNPHAHLLLVIDHAETLVASKHIGPQQRAEIGNIIEALCESPRVLVTMIVRSDFYPKLIEAMPDIAERKSGDGHLDVLTPRPGEIAQIIRLPAMLAGLSFEEDTQTLSRLDDILRDAAAQHPDALPLLQHTLQALYERKSDTGELRFSAYRDIGGLEGALAHRAEEVFAELPQEAKTQLDAILAQLIVIQPDSDAISARWVRWSSLQSDASRALAEAFVRARLFVGELRDGRPGFGVAHEALLRQWPRAREWAQDNRRLLHARARLKRAAARWAEEGRRDDHLLNPGRPLNEALEAAQQIADALTADERDLLRASQRQNRRKRTLRIAAVAMLTTLSIVSSALAVLAIHAQREEERRREEALQLADFMLVDLADKLRPLGNLKLLDSISSEALALLDQRTNAQLDPKDLINRSRALRTLGEVLMQQAKLDEARSAFEAADSTAQLATKRAPDSTTALAEYGVAAYWLGYYHYRQKHFDDAGRHWRAYLRSSERLVALEPSNMTALVEQSYALNNLGTLSRDLGRIDEAIAYFQQSAELKQRALAATPDNTALRYELIDTLSWISSGNESRGKLQQAAAGYATQINMLRDLIDNSPEARAWERRLATSLLRSSYLAIMLGRVDDAQTMIDESILRLRKLTRMEQDNLDWLQNLAQAELIAADLARNRGDATRADTLLQEAQRLSTRLLAASGNRFDTHPDRQRLDAMVRARIALSSAPSPSNDIALDRAITEMSRLDTLAPDDIASLAVFATFRIARGQRHQQAGHTAKALEDWRAVDTRLGAPVARSRDIRIVPLWVEAQALLGRSGPALSRQTEWLRVAGYRHPDYVEALRLADALPSAQLHNMEPPNTASPHMESPHFEQFAAQE